LPKDNLGRIDLTNGQDNPIRLESGEWPRKGALVGLPKQKKDAPDITGRKSEGRVAEKEVSLEKKQRKVMKKK